MRITENQALKWDLCRFFAIAQNDKISCHTERSEVSINLKRGYFANAQYDSNDVNFRFLTQAQYDKINLVILSESEVSTLRSLRSRLSLNSALNLKCGLHF